MRRGWSVESPKCGTGSVQHARFAERVGAFPVTAFNGRKARTSGPLFTVYRSHYRSPFTHMGGAFPPQRSYASLLTRVNIFPLLKRLKKWWSAGPSQAQPSNGAVSDGTSTFGLWWSGGGPRWSGGGPLCEF